jgi:hypothetical protein
MFPAVFSAAICAFAFTESQAQGIYYLRSTGNDVFQLSRVNADGSGDQAINTGLPVTTFPAWSRDGSLLALTSVNPQRPSKISQDVFVYNPVNGTSQLIVPFEDSVTVEPVFSGGIKVGEQNRFSYVVPIYKAFSPDRNHLAVATLVTSGFYQTQQPPALDQLSGTTQTPVLQIYNMASGISEVLVTLGRVRTFYTLGGFGVDWHPSQNLLAVPIDIDAPTIGSLKPSESSTIYLVEAVPNAIELGRVRQLTHPQGFLQSSLTAVTTSLESDYAPAFSPDGQIVAYLRAENTIETNGFTTQHRPISVSIRAVNFDGSNDHLLLQLAGGVFSTQLSWSPDGMQIAFDTGQQPVPQPLQLARLEALPNTLQLSVMNADGSNPHLVHAASAGLPAWQPAPAIAAPRLTVRLEGKPLMMVLSWPAVTQNVTVESSPGLAAAANWKPLQSSVTTANGQSSITIPASNGAMYFRLKI